MSILGDSRRLRLRLLLLLVIPSHGVAAGLTAGHQGVSGGTGGTSANGNVTLGMAFGAHTALIHARIDALVSKAGPVVRTLAVALAFSLRRQSNISFIKNQNFTKFSKIRCIFYQNFMKFLENRNLFL